LFLREKENKYMKKNNYVRISLGFAGFTKDQLNSFLILLLVCLKNNPLFPDLPVKYADLQALVTDYQAKLAASNVGGEVDTAAFQESRDIVIGAHRQIAGYITSLGLTNASDVLSSGFDIIVSGKSPSVLLSQPQFSLSNSVPGQLGVILQAVLNAKAYHVQYATGTGAMIDLAIFPNTRDIVIPNTVAGTIYSARIQAIGGSTLCSTWSGIVSLMST
jgi:hypothetical protein